MGISFGGGVNPFGTFKIRTNIPPSWGTNSGTIGSANGGIPYNFTFVATDIDHGPIPLSIHLASGTLPAGLNISDMSIVGTPVNIPGTYVFTLRLTDGLAEAFRTFSLDVTNQNPIWQTNAGSLGTFYTNTAVNQTLLATDPNNDSITFGVVEGALPPGITLSSAGNLSGTPTMTGITNFTVRASDNHGGAVDRVFTMTVSENIPMTGLVGWWDTSTVTASTGQTVTTLTDLSGAGNHMTGNGTCSIGPNSMKVASGSFTAPHSTTFNHNGEYTTFTVYKSTVPNNTWSSIGFNKDAYPSGATQYQNYVYTNGSVPTVYASIATVPGTASYAQNYAHTNNEWTIGCFRVNYNGTQSWLNYYKNGINHGDGAKITGKTENNTSNAVLNIGSGTLAECLVYTRKLTDTERIQVENYLSSKWGLWVASNNTMMKTDGLLFDFDATAISATDGQTITAWNDRSQYGHHLTGSGKYLTNQVGGKPVLEISSGQSFYRANQATLHHNGEYSGFYVYKQNGWDQYTPLIIKSDWSNNGPTEFQFAQTQNDNSTWYGYCGGNGGRGGNVISVSTLQPQNTFSIVAQTVTYNGSTSLMSFFRNGVSKGSGSQTGKTNQAAAGLSVGGVNATTTKQYIAQIIMFARRLSNAEQNWVQGYLSSKYDIAVTQS